MRCIRSWLLVLERRCFSGEFCSMSWAPGQVILSLWLYRALFSGPWYVQKLVCMYFQFNRTHHVSILILLCFITVACGHSALRRSCITSKCILWLPIPLVRKFGSSHSYTYTLRHWSVAVRSLDCDEHDGEREISVDRMGGANRSHSLKQRTTTWDYFGLNKTYSY